MIYPADAPSPFTAADGATELMIPLVRGGKTVDGIPTLEESRAVVKAGLVSLPWEGLKLSRGDSAVPVRFVGGGQLVGGGQR